MQFKNEDSQQLSLQTEKKVFIDLKAGPRLNTSA